MNDIKIFWGVWVVVRFRVGFNNLFSGFGETKMFTNKQGFLAHETSKRTQARACNMPGFGFGLDGLGWV